MKMNYNKLTELCQLTKDKELKKAQLEAKPRMTTEQKSFAEELYKAHFTPKEVVKLLPFGYGCIASYWQRFKYAKLKKYDRFELIKYKGDITKAHSRY